MKKIIIIFLFILCASCASQTPKQVTIVEYCSTLKECVATISNRIQSKFVRPITLGVPNNRPILNFKVNEEGDLIMVTVINSSGKTAYDHAAITAVTKAAPFPEIKGLEPNERKILQNVNLIVKL